MGGELQHTNNLQRVVVELVEGLVSGDENDSGL